MRTTPLLAAAVLLLSAAAATAAPVPPRWRTTDQVVIETNYGDITVKLYPDKAPFTVANFLGYVDAGFYNDTIFHRVIKDFMIQGGGLDADFKEKSARPPVKNESANGLSNRRGTVAVARAADPDSGTCQFFINIKDNTFLDRGDMGAGYCVFGEVVSGMDVVERIAAAESGPRPPHSDVPVQPVIIKTVRRAK
jgi:cyclophilin family peptidyl-prolyl cis-trans isomerase